MTAKAGYIRSSGCHNLRSARPPPGKNSRTSVSGGKVPALLSSCGVKHIGVFPIYIRTLASTPRKNQGVNHRSHLPLSYQTIHGQPEASHSVFGLEVVREDERSHPAVTGAGAFGSRTYLGLDAKGTGVFEPPLFSGTDYFL
jgi:hypothetical protein